MDLKGCTCLHYVIELLLESVSSMEDATSRVWDGTDVA
jgi:hypothetical protein